MTLDERLAAALHASPEVASLNMGSMNFGLYPALERYKEFNQPWERAHLGALARSSSSATPSRISRACWRSSARATAPSFEFECYDIGHLYTLAHFLERGLVKPPLFVQTIFGILGGIGADLENLHHMKRIADKLFGEQYQWSVLAAGRHQMTFVTQAVLMGGNVRVGLEDSLYAGKGKLAKNNAEQVAKIRRIIEELSFEVASPEEARKMLDLKGGDRVTF
jgi:uncharacterized protein (DUF849 family)